MYLMNILSDVYICPLSKMYIFGSIANSQRMPTEINESGAIAKIRISVESDTVNRLKAFRIILAKCQFHFLS